MATAIASLVRDVPVADDLGMTGEVTLTGRVLPIGGVREKALPHENEPDLEELPAETRRELEVVLVDSIDQVFAAAFNGNGRGRIGLVPAQERNG